MSRVFSSMRQYGSGLALGVTLTALVATWSVRQEARAVPTVADAIDLSIAFRKVAADVTPSIVSIQTLTKGRQVEMQRNGAPENLPFPEFFRDDPRFQEFFRGGPRRGMTPQKRGGGSGFVIDPSGIIMTNNHVVAGADEVRVHFLDGREFLAKEIKTDPRTDVAIIRIEGAGELKPLKLGDSRDMQVGDWVLAIGSPFGLESTVTQGIISGKSRSRNLADREDFLQTDAAINPGNSGGPLLNLKGEVIGINTAIASASGGYDGIGFAIPTHIAGWVGEQLVKSGSVKRGYLGTAIAPVNSETARQFNVTLGEGAVVRSVMPNSPADKAGLEPSDVVLTLNGQKISGPVVLQGIVERLDIGKTYPLEIVRSGKRETLKVTIEEMPVSFASKTNGREPSETQPATFDDLGLQVKNLTRELAKQLGLDATKGVLVAGVKDGSPASNADVQAGDLVERVGQTPVTTVEEYNKAVSSLSLKDGVVLHLRNENGKRYVVLKSEE
ncbi:MAG TPA: Do family serine endopeptidase [Planctomycetaceae bacterium]|nr:Do family serine endopeptidase [Planctomycetaceae bacterium]